ncbi:hypothetical protein [Paenibacillus donghaensis]|uniref:Uncharacterized protein n=1 Tax=Paenibacillus donghaensis TaxID=414771 RepID=A0A2Z2KAM5_9BACL|nr:hypothetical protein [Paenibacillus donghaensis]ASA22674.1 hypothetical protein B9T62_18885 [Paenibacillus donghaensis]
MALAEERETVIRISDADDQWDIYSASSKVMNKMSKAGFEPYKTDSEGNSYYKVGYEQVSFRKKSDSKRVMSDERRAALAANLAKGRANKKKKNQEEV